MSSKSISSLIITFILIFVAMPASAMVTLIDTNDWKFLFSGFAELDMINDSTRSLTEVAGSTPIDQPGTYAGDNARTQFSIRNSRFAFTGLAPVQNDWKTKGYLEFDLLGYDPSPTSTGGSTEAAYFTNPSLRVRHAYVSGEKEGLKILAGQTWTLFGWEPEYVLTTASVPPVTASTYERTPQVLIIKDWDLNETDKIQGALSFERPEQRDSEIPNIDAGLRWTIGSRRSGFSAPSTDILVQPMSIGISGTFREYEFPNPTGTSTSNFTLMGGAVAANALIPIIASDDDKETGNTLTLTGEFTSGLGYGDEFPSWTANLPTFTQSSTVPTTNPNLDPGIAGLDTSGNFQLVKMQTFNGQLQYHFSDGATFMTGGYGQIYSTNAGNLTANTGKIQSPKAEVYFLNLFHDFTKQVRGALEYDRFNTYYVDGVTAPDSRIQLSAWYRF